MRQVGSVRDAAILMASGIRRNGKRTILGVSLSLSEAQEHWRAFLESLVARGLHGVQLVVSDDHAGLQAARKVFFTGIIWQRCLSHLQQNAQSYVPCKAMQKEVAADIRMIFNAPNKAQAEAYLAEVVKKYENVAPRTGGLDGSQFTSRFFILRVSSGALEKDPDIQLPRKSQSRNQTADESCACFPE